MLAAGQRRASEAGLHNGLHRPAAGRARRKRPGSKFRLWVINNPAPRPVRLFTHSAQPTPRLIQYSRTGVSRRRSILGAAAAAFRFFRHSAR